MRVQYDASAGVAMLRLEMQYQLNTGSPYIYNPAGSTPRLLIACSILDICLCLGFCLRPGMLGR